MRKPAPTQILLFAIGVFFAAYPFSVRAQDQTTQQLPLPAGQTQTQSADKRWQITLDSDFRNMRTKETFAGSPATLWTNFSYTPIGLSLAVIPNDQFKIELGVRGGYQQLHQVSNLGGNASYSGWTDTSLTSTVTYYGFNGFQPFIGLAANLPTGQSLVTSPIAAAPADADVTGIAGFGEGLNVGPTVGVNVPITKDLLTTFAVGYTARGSFRRSGVGIFGATPETINPGNVTTVTGSIGYQAGPWSLQGSVAYSLEGATAFDSIDVYKNGQKVAVSGGVGYAWTEALSSKLSSSFTHINRNKYAENPRLGQFELLREQFDTNSNVTTVAFDTTYKFRQFAVGPTVSYLYRDHNGYDSFSTQFLSAKTKWSGGGAAQYAVTNQISFNARVERLWMTIDEMPATGAPTTDIRGWTASIGGKAVY